MPAALVRPALALLSLPLLALACGPGLEPSATPAPAAGPPADETPAPPPADAASFAWGPGTETYLVERRATIEVVGDTAVQDTVVTTARVQLSLATTRLAGVVDSFAVRAGPRVPVAPAPVLPLPFSGTVEGGRVTLDASRDAAAVCRPDATVLASAGELFPTIVAHPVGARWADTVVAESCRGGARLTTVAIHQYQGERQAQDGLPPLLRVERTTALTVRGAGRMARTPVAAEGEGTGRGTFLLDPVAGHLLEARTETTLQLTVDAAGRTERVTQRAETTVRRQ